MKKKRTGKKTAGTVLAFSFVCAVLLLTGCGKEKTEEEPENTGVTVISVENQVSHATEEMNEENEKANQPEPWEQKTEEQNAENQNSTEQNAENGAEQNTGEQNTETASQPTEEEPQLGEREGSKLQIVFLGDSILDGYRDDTGIAYLTGVYCNADVYNLAMGGTTAALTTYENAEYDKWTSRSLQGVVHAICGDVDKKILDGYKAGEIFDQCDFSKTDYFVIGYGMNDFLSGIPLNDDDDFYDEYTYVGALRIAIESLKNHFPDAQIVLASPNYAHFFREDGSYVGDGNTASYGGANLVEYYRVCGNVAADMGTLFLNAYEGIGLDAYTADEYLEDGIHLSEKGRRKYAEKLSQIILEYEETKNN